MSNVQTVRERVQFTRVTSSSNTAVVWAVGLGHVQCSYLILKQRKYKLAAFMILKVVKVLVFRPLPTVKH